MTIPNCKVIGVVSTFAVIASVIFLTCENGSDFYEDATFYLCFRTRGGSGTSPCIDSLPGEDSLVLSIVGPRIGSAPQSSSSGTLAAAMPVSHFPVLLADSTVVLCDKAISVPNDTIDPYVNLYGSAWSKICGDSFPECDERSITFGGGAFFELGPRAFYMRVMDTAMKTYYDTLRVYVK